MSFTPKREVEQCDPLIITFLSTIGPLGHLLPQHEEQGIGIFNACRC